MIARNLLLPACIAGLLPLAITHAQSAQVGTPLVGASDSFFERFGVGFSWTRGNAFFNQGSFGSALPPFGGYDPASGLQSGFGLSGGFGQLGFRFEAAGSSRSLTMGAPSVTLQSGYPGGFQAVQQRPFVTGIIPVAGGNAVLPHDRVGRWREGERPARRSAEERSTSGAAADSGLRLADTSSAAAGEASLAAIRRELAEEDRQRQDRIAHLLNLAATSERDGKSAAARILRQQAERLRQQQ